MHRGIAGGLVALSFVPASAGEIIYSRWSSTSSNIQAIATINEPGESSSRFEIPAPQGLEFEAQNAQRLTFGGTSRHVTQLELRFGGFRGPTTPANVDVTVRFYAVAGSAPGGLLWSGQIPSLAVPQHTSPGIIATLTPNVTVPDSVYLAFEFTSISGQGNSDIGLGCDVFQSPTIGQADPLWAAELSATGQWTFYQTTPPMNFIARVTAIPAPWSIAAILAPLFWRRRK